MRHRRVVKRMTLHTGLLKQTLVEDIEESSCESLTSGLTSSAFGVSVFSFLMLLFNNSSRSFLLYSKGLLGMEMSSILNDSSSAGGAERWCLRNPASR